MLVGRILFGKSWPDENLLNCHDKSSESHGWRGILTWRDLLKRKSGWLIGNGNKVDLWTDPCITTGDNVV